MTSNVLPFQKPAQAPVSHTLAVVSTWVALPAAAYWMWWRLAELALRTAFGR